MKDKHRTTRIGSHELSPRSLMMGGKAPKHERTASPSTPRSLSAQTSDAKRALALHTEPPLSPKGPNGGVSRSRLGVSSSFVARKVAPSRCDASSETPDAPCERDEQ